jgi:hypothetical protein
MNETRGCTGLVLAILLSLILWYGIYRLVVWLV